MRVLVTGGGGFLGRVIVRRLLARGYTVRVLGRQARPDLEAQGVEVLCGDLSDADFVAKACEGQEAVFHVAAKAGVWGKPEDYFYANVIGSRSVLAGCQAARVSYLIYTSTPSVVFNGMPIQGGDERMPYGSQWLCEYARTKAVAEAETLGAHGDFGVKICALRPHLIWGEGDPHLIPRVVARARAGRLSMVGDGMNRVDITHVENAALAHVLALDALMAGKAGGKAYFISQGEPVALWPWINELLTRLGERPVKRKVPLPVAFWVGAFLEGLWANLRLKGEPPMTRFVSVELSKDHYFDISAARRDLGYRPEVSTAEGLDRLVASLKA